jgi:hypothetical protein
VGDIELATMTKVGVETVKPVPSPIKIDAYRESVKAISAKIVAKETVAIDNPVRFAKEAVKAVVDDEGTVTGEPIWGCVKLTPELQFFPIVGGK